MLYQPRVVIDDDDVDDCVYFHAIDVDASAPC
jgi:hypothetical protein